VETGRHRDHDALAAAPLNRFSLALGAGHPALTRLPYCYWCW
jgi:hypothetical protein